MIGPLPPAPPAPPAVAALAARADARLARGDAAGAARLLARPGSSPALGCRLGAALLAQGDFARAGKVYNAVLKAHRGPASAYVGMAWAWIGLEQFGMAVFPLRQALVLAPRFEPGWRELGHSLYMQHRYLAASEAETRAIALAPRDAAAWRWQGLALAYGREPLKALPVLARAEALAPGDAVVARERGRVLLDAGRPKEALPLLESARRLAPRDPIAQELLVRAYRTRGQLWRALATWLDRPSSPAP